MMHLRAAKSSRRKAALLFRGSLARGASTSAAVFCCSLLYHEYEAQSERSLALGFQDELS
jgi:hypothetical protein